VVRLTTTLPINAGVGAIALSRDGSRIAYTSGPQRQIYVRMMDQLESRPIPGTDGAGFLGFSPDGEWIGFVTVRPDMKLKKISVAGGPPQVLADLVGADGPPLHDWGLDGNIRFILNGALVQIPAAGGKPQTLAARDLKKDGFGLLGPQLLPGRKQVLVSIGQQSGTIRGANIVVLNLETGERKILIEHASGVPRYLHTGPGSSAGYIVYYTPITGSLMAAPFDAARMELRGSPVPVVDGVQSAGGFGSYAISDSGTLAYVAGSSGQSSSSALVWVDRKGVEQPVPGPPRIYASVRLSPDGERIAFEAESEETDIWVYAHGTSLKITGEQHGRYPVWTTDGKRLIYRQGLDTLAEAPADNSGPPSVLANMERPVPTSVSPDGKLAIGYYSSTGGLWVLPLPEGSSGNAKPQSFLDSRSFKAEPAFSPDGRWVAYRSDETGVREIYVAPYPGPGPKSLISPDGGTTPRWSRDQRELFYRSGARVMAVDVQTDPSFRTGAPKVLFEGTNYVISYDVSPDGKRFLMIKRPAAAQSSTDQVTLVLNWFEELRRRAPAQK
jgi:Tol biopolymer transport system component